MHAAVGCTMSCTVRYSAIYQPEVPCTDTVTLSRLYVYDFFSSIAELQFQLQNTAFITL